MGVSHRCSKTGGRLIDGGDTEVVCGGRAMLLSTKSAMRGGTVVNQDFICQTERNLASVLQV